MPAELIRFDSAAAVANWLPIDDAVMGGASWSRMRLDPQGWAVFEGAVSLEYNGGFASVRSRPASFGCADAAAYVLEVRGDGKHYKLNLRTDDAFDGVNYQARFEAPADVWTRLRIAVADFRPSFRGRSVPGAPALDPGKLRQIGLMIADRQQGPFSLAIRSIAVARGSAGGKG
jgi:hypothetical protein